MKTNTYLIITLFLGIQTYFFLQDIHAQSIKDSVSFSNNYTNTTLQLTFNKKLDFTTLFGYNFPFRIALASPLDSLTVMNGSRSEDSLSYTFSIETKPENYYSILFSNIVFTDSSESFMHIVHFYSGIEPEFVTSNFTNSTGPVIKINSDAIQDFEYPSEEIEKAVIVNAVIEKHYFETSLNDFKINDYFDFYTPNFQSSIRSFNILNNVHPYDFGAFYEQAELKVPVSLPANDSVGVIAFLLGNPDSQKDTLLSHFYTYDMNFEENQQFIAKPFSKWDNTEFWLLSFIYNSIEPNENIPSSFTLTKIYPNPFNPSTNLSFSLTNSSSISFSVYDILGRSISSLEQKDIRYSPGTHSLSYDFSGLPSGTYFIEAIGTELGSGQVSRQVAKVSLVK